MNLVKYVLFISITLSFTKQNLYSKTKEVKIKFVYSPYADFLYFLFYHNQRWLNLDSIIPVDSLPTIQSLLTFPEMVALKNIKDYKELYKLLEIYKNATNKIVVFKPKPILLKHDSLPVSYDTLRILIKKGEKYFPTFKKYWKQNIKPLEEKLIDKWKKELDSCHVIKKLQELTRLKFSFDTIYVGCIALHFSGSAYFYPPAIYSTIFNKEANSPDLGLLIGHESTHLLINEYVGKNWKKHPLAEKAISLVIKNGGKEYYIEEALCLFMQVKLSQECNFMRQNIKMSDYLKDPILKKLCKGFEKNWENYKKYPDKYPTIIDFMLKTAIQIFSKNYSSYIGIRRYKYSSSDSSPAGSIFTGAVVP